MRIEGYFGRFGAPYIETAFICEKFGIKKSIKFLVDSGASRTIISENDAIRMGIDYSKLEKLEEGMTGVGGIADAYLLKNVELVFLTKKEIYIEKMDDILVIKHEIKDKLMEERMKWIPSLLGRDILDKFTIFINKKKEIVLITDEEI